MLDNRSFGGAQVSRTFYARGQTGQQLLLGAYQALARQNDLTVGDPVEIEALGTLLTEAGVRHETAPWVGSVKANIGHTMSAAGVAGVIRAALALRHETVPPARFTEASLIKELERLGIGRPSTYAPTIATMNRST